MKRRRERADLPPDERCFDCDLPIAATRVCVEIEGDRVYFHRGCHPAWERRQRYKPGKAPPIVELDPKAELARVLGLGGTAAPKGAAPEREQTALPLGDVDASEQPSPAEARRDRRFR